MTKSAGPALRGLHEQFGDRVAFLALYVREAHPGDRYPQPETAERKRAHAADYRSRDELPWPVAVDALDGDLHRALDPKPNALYLVDAQGDVAGRTLWANERQAALRKALDAVASGRTPVGERTPRLIPMLRGTGTMAEVLGLSGAVAQRDVLKQAPPMYAMARLAALFRPLSPLGRGLAAQATTMAAGALLAAAIRRRITR